MKIPCKDIASILEQFLKTHIAELATKPKLITFLLGAAPEQLSFVGIKKRLAERIGASFELRHYPLDPPFSGFRNKISDTAHLPDTTGIIIQHPLPKNFNTSLLYEVIMEKKEIEGHKPGSHFQFPLSLAVLAGLKYIISHESNHSYIPGIESIVNFQADADLFASFLSDKKVVVAGRGITGGNPISKALNDIGVVHAQVHSQTTDAHLLYQKADVIITATGRKIVTPDILKKGVILLNVGLRKENNKLKGDYDEEEIKDIASYYTETPGGLGPLDVLYLYKNLYDAAILQSQDE